MISLVVVATAILLVSYHWLVRYTWLGRLLNGPRSRSIDGAFGMRLGAGRGES